MMRTDPRFLLLIVATAVAVHLLDRPRAPIRSRTATAPAISVANPPATSFLATHRQRHRFGFIDAQGHFTIPPRYADVRAFSEGRAAVCVPGAEIDGPAPCRWGFVDTAGNLVISAAWDDALSFSGRRAPVCRRVPGQGCRWGAIDLQGRLVVPPRYERLREFREGLAAFSVEGYWGFIDPLGQEVIPARFRMASDFGSGLAAVLIDGRWGYADRTGKLVIPASWNRATRFADGLASVQRNNESYCLAPDGALLPRAAWPVAAPDRDAPVPTRDGSRWGFVDRSLAPVIPATFLEARAFSEGLAAVRIGSRDRGAWGYVNPHGAVVIAPRFERAGPHRHGFALVERGGGIAYVDRQGRLFNGPRSELGDAACGRASPLQSVAAEAGPALADPFGHVVLAAREGRGRTAVEGLAVVEEGGKVGWVDLQGRWIVRPRFRRVEDFHEGLAPVAEQAVYGYARPDGALAIPARFRLAGAFSGGLAWVGMSPTEAAQVLALR